MATETDINVRKGIKLYIDYFETEFKDLTDEEVGILIRALYQYDQFGQPKKEYSEKIDSDRMLKSVFKRISINNDRAVEKWNQTREYFAKKDKEKRIKEIMKSENCSHEEALDIYNFEKDDEPVKSKNKDKNDLFSEIEDDPFSSVSNNKIHNFIIFGVSISIKFENEIDFLNEDLEDEFSEVADYAEHDEIMFKDIVNKSFKLAVKDNFKKSLKDYCNLVLEEI